MFGSSILQEAIYLSAIHLKETVSGKYREIAFCAKNSNARSVLPTGNTICVFQSATNSNQCEMGLRLSGAVKEWAIVPSQPLCLFARYHLPALTSKNTYTPSDIPN